MGFEQRTPDLVYGSLTPDGSSVFYCLSFSVCGAVNLRQIFVDHEAA